MDIGSNAAVPVQVCNQQKRRRRSVTFNWDQLSTTPAINSLNPQDQRKCFGENSLYSLDGEAPRRIRGDLPWLEGKRSRSPMPGTFSDSTESVLSDVDTTSADTPGGAQQRPSICSINGHDLSVRMLGSTPAITPRPRQSSWRPLSLTSQQRPGNRLALSKELGLRERIADSNSPEIAKNNFDETLIHSSPSALAGSQSGVDTTLDRPRRRNIEPSQRKQPLDATRLPTTSLVKHPRQDARVPLVLSQPSTERPALSVGPSRFLEASMSTSGDLSPRSVTPVSVLPPWDSQEKAHSTPSSIDHAVKGLESLMMSAVEAAQQAADAGKLDEATQILTDATDALRKSSTVSGQMSSPLVLSDSETCHTCPSLSSRSVSSECSITSSSFSQAATVITAPTVGTQSARSSRQPVNSIISPRKAFNDGVPDRSMTATPPCLYQPSSAESIVRDFAYWRPRIPEPPSPPLRHDSADSDGTVNVCLQYATRQGPNSHFELPSHVNGGDGSRPRDFVYWEPKVVPAPSRLSTRTSASSESSAREHFVGLPSAMRQTPRVQVEASGQSGISEKIKSTTAKQRPLRRLDPIPIDRIPPRSSSVVRTTQASPATRRRRQDRQPNHPHLSALASSPYYSQSPGRHEPQVPKTRNMAAERYDASHPYPSPPEIGQGSEAQRHHVSLREGQGFSLGRHHRRQPIAREWKMGRKRLTAVITCFNTIFIGLISGIYAGEVPKIQYVLADRSHTIILGNVLLYCGIAITTLLFWPLPLLHGRKPYTLVAYTMMLPLQFPQALSVSAYRDPNSALYRVGLLFPRILTGMAMGFANINLLPTLFDLFGASLMSEKPHGELVLVDDVRRQGGGIGIWLGIWTWCYIGSLSIGFCVGAGVIAHLDPSWGFYVVVILLALFLFLNVLMPETRRAAYRRSIAHFFDETDEQRIRRRVARGEVKLHISNEGPKWWWQECWAGLMLIWRMTVQPGFFILMLYLAWIYAEVVLVILLLGALLSRDYQWHPQYVGLANLSVAVGSGLAIPLSKAGLFSRARTGPPRTDSMTFQPRVTWTSHLVRRCIFTLVLPLVGVAYTLASPGPSVNWAVPVVMVGLAGFLSHMAIAECIGLIMETFDTCDLQPGVNTKHRLQSMASETRRRRTNYSCFPRVCAGWFASQTLGFLLAATATGVSGTISRALGAQKATAVVASILLLFTLLLAIVLWRHTEAQVIPNSVFGTERRTSGVPWAAAAADDPYWNPVVIGNPSGKMRRMNLLELGSMSRWTEIRKLNKLIRK